MRSLHDLNNYSTTFPHATAQTPDLLTIPLHFGPFKCVETWNVMKDETCLEYYWEQSRKSGSDIKGNQDISRSEESFLFQSESLEFLYRTDIKWDKSDPLFLSIQFNLRRPGSLGSRQGTECKVCSIYSSNIMFESQSAQLFCCTAEPVWRNFGFE